MWTTVLTDGCGTQLWQQVLRRTGKIDGCVTRQCKYNTTNVMSVSTSGTGKFLCHSPAAGPTVEFAVRAIGGLSCCRRSSLPGRAPVSPPVRVPYTTAPFTSTANMPVDGSVGSAKVAASPTLSASNTTTSAAAPTASTPRCGARPNVCACARSHVMMASVHATSRHGHCRLHCGAPLHVNLQVLPIDHAPAVPSSCEPLAQEIAAPHHGCTYQAPAETSPRAAGAARGRSAAHPSQSCCADI